MPQYTIRNPLVYYLVSDFALSLVSFHKTVILSGSLVSHSFAVYYYRTTQRDKFALMRVFTSCGLRSYFKPTRSHMLSASQLVLFSWRTMLSNSCACLWTSRGDVSVATIS